MPSLPIPGGNQYYPSEPPISKELLVRGTTKYYWYCFLHQLWYKTLCTRPDRGNCLTRKFWCWLYNFTGRMGAKYYRKIHDSIEYGHYMALVEEERHINDTINEMKW